jgi:hypothetical protein
MASELSRRITTRTSDPAVKSLRNLDAAAENNGPSIQ